MKVGIWVLLRSCERLFTLPDQIFWPELQSRAEQSRAEHAHSIIPMQVLIVTIIRLSQVHIIGCYDN